MAFDLLDEHEQGELVQKWLRENAISIVVGVLLGLVLIFGWQQWKTHLARHTAEAAVQYQALTDALSAKHAGDIDKIADALRKDYPDTVYASLAAMNQADAASWKGDLASAASDLDWAMQHAGDSSMKSLVALRLARVKLSQGDAGAAIKLLDGVPKDSYTALGSEIRGDALVKLGRIADARAAYEQALAHLDEQGSSRAFVQMKLDEIAAAPTTAATGSAPVPPPAAPAKGKLGS